MQQLCQDCGADIADRGHRPECPLIQTREQDPRYEGIDEILQESQSINRVVKTPKTPDPDMLPDRSTNERWAKGRPA